MEQIKEVKLPSGATLKIGQIPFGDAKALTQAILGEIRGVRISMDTKDLPGLTDMYKNFFCAGFTSLVVENAMKTCFARCLYNNLKFDDSTFEPLSSRQDYMVVCTEVAKEATTPFLKSLFANYQAFIQMVGNTQQ